MTELTQIDSYGALTGPDTLRIQRLLPGPIERVWAYLVDGELRRQWLAAGKMEPVEGAPFELVWRNDELTGPRVVVGDLNEWFPGAVGRTLRRELAGPHIRRTHPAPLPLFPLDRIHWDRDLGADGFRVHRSRLARVASDHLPVVARLRLSTARD